MHEGSFIEHPLVIRLRRIVVVLLVLVFVGALLRPIESPAWQVVKSGQSELNLEGIEGSLGQGLVVGVLGGFRAIMADFMWIRVNTIWERRDRTKLDALIRLSTTLDPRQSFFWFNGARMIAYDVPNWRIREEGGYSEVPEARQDEINREQAEQAFIFLEKAREFHPDEPKLVVEVAQIYLNRLKDIPNAAEWFLKTSKMPNAPYFAARIYAELLRRQGLDREAYDYLRELYSELPNDPYAQKNIILERIRTLEEELEIPYLLRFNPSEVSPAITPTHSQPVHSHHGHSH